MRRPLSGLLPLAFCVAVGCGGRSEPVEEPPATTVAADSYFDPQRLRDVAFSGSTAAVEGLLKQGGDANATDREGRTALMLAAFNGHTEVVRLLLAHGAQVDMRDSAGRTALMFSASGPFAETVKLLLEHDADPDLIDSGEGWSALMFAAGEGHAAVLRVLLEHGADPGLTDADGDSAIAHARRRRHQEAVQILGVAAQGSS